MFRMSGRGLPRAPLEGLILICLNMFRVYGVSVGCVFFLH